MKTKALFKKLHKKKVSLPKKYFGLFFEPRFFLKKFHIDYISRV